MRAVADDVVCAITPEPFHAVGRWYQDFSQTTDDEVRELLADREKAAEPPTRRATDEDTLIERLRGTARLLDGTEGQYDPLIDRIGDAQFVLLGEASHGTHEFYRERAEITKRLIKEKNFTAVAVEAPIASTDM